MNKNDALVVAEAIALAVENYRKYTTIELVAPERASGHVADDVRAFLLSKAVEVSSDPVSTDSPQPKKKVLVEAPAVKVSVGGGDTVPEKK